MLSILLVEDHLIFAGVVVRLLNRLDNMQVAAVANTAEAALQKLSRPSDCTKFPTLLGAVARYVYVDCVRDRFTK